MKIRIVLNLIGIVLKVLGVLLLVPGIVAALYHETDGLIAFALTSLLSMSTGIILKSLGDADSVGNKEAFAAVTLGWLFATFFGSLPFVFQGISLVDALFESISGFSATGATILIESNALGYYMVNATLADNSVATNLAGSLFGLMGSDVALNATHSLYLLRTALLASLPAAYWRFRHNSLSSSSISAVTCGRAAAFSGGDSWTEQGHHNATCSWYR